jgi:lipoprotein-anchoring transpeptidase ErfK/SrfK
LPITEITVGDLEPTYNRIWYKIAEEGYAHSGGLQPVKTQLNEPVLKIPDGGVLAEVTVPYTDAFWGPGQQNKFAYRFYYETTHWVIGSVQDIPGDPWYIVLDDKWEYEFYVPSSHMRIIPESELTPLSPHVHSSAKRIEVDISDQLVIAYEWDRPVFMARVATGTALSNNRYLTPTGTHQTFQKRPSRHMAAGNLANPSYDLPGVPWNSYITKNGIAFHGTFWHNDYGKPRSHGCLNLTPKAAKWIYRWTIPEVPSNEQWVYKDFGTAVDVSI